MTIEVQTMVVPQRCARHRVPGLQKIARKILRAEVVTIFAVSLFHGCEIVYDDPEWQHDDTSKENKKQAQALLGAHLKEFRRANLLSDSFSFQKTQCGVREKRALLTKPLSLCAE
jgi:hypothetical protein